MTSSGPNVLSHRTVPLTHLHHPSTSLKLHNLPRIQDQVGVKSQLDRLVKFDHAGADEFLKVFETAVADAVLTGELSARSR